MELLSCKKPAVVAVDVLFLAIIFGSGPVSRGKQMLTTNSWEGAMGWVKDCSGTGWLNNSSPVSSSRYDSGRCMRSKELPLMNVVEAADEVK